MNKNREKRIVSNDPLKQGIVASLNEGITSPYRRSDCGAIVIKNGVVLNATDMIYGDMKREVGWSDADLWYSDCDCQHEMYDFPGSRKISMCSECPKAKEISSVEIKDCHGNLRTRNEFFYDGICSAFVGDEEFTVAIIGYEARFFVNKKQAKGYHHIVHPIGEFWDYDDEDNKKVFYGEIQENGVKFKITHIIPFVNSLEFNYKGDRYCIIFGYKVKKSSMDINFFSWMENTIDRLYDKKDGNRLKRYIKSRYHDCEVKVLIDDENFTKDYMFIGIFGDIIIYEIATRYNLPIIEDYASKFKSLEDIADFLNEYYGFKKFIVITFAEFKLYRKKKQEENK